jgi:predicted naringenin-chalcone synthase
MSVMKRLTVLSRPTHTRLSLEQGALDHDYGNMSAPTALFVLERLIQSGLPLRTYAAFSALDPFFNIVRQGLADL